MPDPITPGPNTLEPTTSEFLNAANWTYAANSPNNTTGIMPLYPTGLQPLMVNGQQLTSLVNADGFYGAAFVTASQQVIVALEGTSPDQIIADTEFGRAQVAADGLIYVGLPAPAFADAMSFTSTVQQAALAQGIPGSSVFISGHSLGAAEAEYVSAQTGIAGETFGAPGISQYLIPHGANGANLTDYIESGDPVGNYAADSGTEGNFLSSQTIEHYGQTSYLGSVLDAGPLYVAGALFGQSDEDTATALGLLAVNAAEFHPTGTYAASLGVTLTNPGPVYDYNAILLTLENILSKSGVTRPAPFLAASGAEPGDIGKTASALVALASIAATSHAADAFQRIQSPAATPALAQNAAMPALSLGPAHAAPTLVPGEATGQALAALIQLQHG